MRIGRLLNSAFVIVYGAIECATMPGSRWFYVMYGAIEIAFCVVVVYLAWTWPKYSP